MTAGSGEGWGRHAHPDDPEELVAEEQVAAAPGPEVDAGATQALPIFRREATDESPRVRAVAPRVASALPAIGGDEIRDAPASARANIERRRRVQQEETGEVEPAVAAFDTVDTPDRAERADPDRPGAEPPAMSGSMGASAQIVNDVELVPIGSKAGPRRVPSALLAAGAPTGEPASTATAPSAEASPFATHPNDPSPPSAEPPALPLPAVPPPAVLPTAVPPVPTEIASPVLNPPRAALPPAARPPEPPPAPTFPEVVDAEIIDDPTGEHRAVVGASAPDADRGEFGAAAAEMVSALTYVAFRDAQTDEWATVAGEPAAQPRADGLPAGGEPDVAPPTGPGLMEADSWDTSALPVIADDSYQGRRRRASTGSLARWLVVLGVVLALSAAVAIPFLLTSGDGPANQDAEGPRPSGSGAPSLAVSPTPGGTDDPYMPIGQASATPSAIATSPSVTGSSNPSPSADGGTALQAESAVLSGCAQVRAFSGASGGSIVDRLGSDWNGCRGTGVVTFNNVSLQAGTYTVTIYYVFGQTNTDQSRSARLRINPDGAGGNIDFTHSYVKTDTCCQSWTTGTFTVSAGTFDISFTNPGVPGQDRAPALDRVVIQKV